jgi:hypothetical protein
MRATLPLDPQVIKPMHQFIAKRLAYPSPCTTEAAEELS